MLAVTSLLLLAQTVPQSFEIKGPNMACGKAFAMRLQHGERMIWTDLGMDCVTYRLIQSQGTIVIYEGNAPQPGGFEFKTGRDWPAVVVVHGPKAVARRLIVGLKQPQLCANRAGKP